jgi:S1-C subfamily serine protease
MKTAVSCFASALLGGFVVLAVVDPRLGPDQPAAGQDLPPSGPLVPEPAPADDSATSRDDDGEWRPARRAPLPGPSDRQAAPAPTEQGLFLPGPAISGRLTPEEEIAVRVYEQVHPSVVRITTRALSADSHAVRERRGTGAGCILDREGRILTNYHVIQAARRVAVTLAGGSTWPARFVGADPHLDVAVIRIDAPPERLAPIALGESAGLRVGMRAFAIGNPFGLDQTLAAGVISSTDRSLEMRGAGTMRSLIQIDAAINPGHSGGPLVNTRGEMIGMNTAIATLNGQSAGVGFAIPVDRIRAILPLLVGESAP